MTRTSSPAAEVATGPVQPEKLSKAIARDIVRQISDDHLTPGTQLLAEQEMAQLYGAGRWTVREALRLLEMQGLIAIRRGQGGGPVVRAPLTSDFGETMSMYLQASGTRMRALHEAYPLLEGDAAYLAAERVRSGSVREDVLAAVVSHGGRDLSRVSGEDFRRESSDFHYRLHEICDNPILALIAGAACHVVNDRASEPGTRPVDLRQRSKVTKFHIDIAGAVCDGNSNQARATMEAHMRDQMEFFARADPSLPNSSIDWR